MSPTRVYLTGAGWFGTSPGGLSRYFTDLWRALQAIDGLDVTAAAFGAPDDPGGISWPGGGLSLPARMLASADPRLVPPGAVIDRHFAPYGPLGRTPAKHPVVTHFHGPWAAESAAAGESPRSVRIKKLIELTRYRGSDAYVVLSSFFRDVLVRDYGVDASRVRVIAPGVDLQRFAASPVPAGRPTVLCVRRLERRMGIDVLLQAWPQVTSALADARLIIVGEGSQEQDLRDRARDLSGVEFTGKVGDDRLRALYGEATVTAVPTRSLEGFGLIALESLASGRAPVLTDAGGLPESVLGLDASLIVPRDDAAALGERLVRALDGDRPDAVPCRAHAETFTWAASAQRHAELYRELAP